MAFESTNSPFPTSATVPFPFDSPYTVQRELMDAILASLRQCQQVLFEPNVSNADADEAANGDTIDNNHCSLSLRTNQMNRRKRRRAPIIMVESPTGTGKSMSLACASMAWLRYCEEADLADLLKGSSNKSNADNHFESAATNEKRPSSSHEEEEPAEPAAKKKKVYDWIEAWQPSSNNCDQAILPPSSTPPSLLSSAAATTTTQSTQQERIASFARQNRLALNNELQSIRSRLDRLLNVALAAAAANNNDSNNNNNSIREQERKLRKNLVRSGVSSALSQDRTRKRKRNLIIQKQQQQYKRSTSGDRSGNCVNENNVTRTTTENEDDFLVEEYHSDGGGGGGKRRDDDFLSSDSDDCDKNDDRILIQSQQSKQFKRQQQQQSLSARALLEGSNLDGSGYQYDAERNAVRRKWENRDTCDKDGKTSSSSVHSDKVTSVGGVTPGSGLRKIIYAARTHSQLSQFVSELRRTHWGTDVKVVALGSRSLLCCNNNVMYRSSQMTNKNNSSRRSEADITEMCLDMQKSKSGGVETKKDKNEQKSTKGSGCPYLVSRDAISTLAMHSMVRPSDIEDMASLGRASFACSYYASREALGAAEVVVLPYNMLLSPQSRQSVGLSIKNALIVIDEAHNIPETLRALTSCKLSLQVAEAALAQLLSYTRKYSGRLAGRNLFYLGQICKILSAMAKYLKRGPTQGEAGLEEVVTNDESKDNVTLHQRKKMIAAVDLMFTLKLDNINLFSILRYLKKSRLSQKLLGFINHTAESTSNSSPDSVPNGPDTQNNAEFMSKHVSSMSIFENFLEKLTGTSREGKIIIEWPSEDSSTSSSSGIPALRFVQIHSASQLDNVLEEAHAVILAGGTLRPFSHVAAELFGDDVNVVRAASNAEGQLSRNFDIFPSSNSSQLRLPPSSVTHITPSLTTFTCGHVIPPNNVMTACLSTGPTCGKFDFRHSTRSSNQMIDELGRAIVNLCNVVPSGFVVFLPSYKYESQVFQRWRSTGMLSQIDNKKRVHREPKNSRDVEDALTRYSSEASSPSKKGALLFSVMGGKMSEGINFANDMARCVLVVGLPFPDITDPVLKEKMESLDKEFRRNGTGINGQDYYQNLCMRTVNQSVGRAIRHSHDYAAIVLCDYRYSSETRIWRSLPQWLRKGCGAPNSEDASFGKVLKNMRSFFNGR